MAGMRHPNVLPLLAAFVEGGSLWMVLPFYAAGSLLSIVQYRHPEVHCDPRTPLRPASNHPCSLCACCQPCQRSACSCCLASGKTLRPPVESLMVRHLLCTTAHAFLPRNIHGGQKSSSEGPVDTLRLQGVTDWHAVATIMREVARGLAYMHHSGRIHRDLKAANILVAPDGRVALAGGCYLLFQGLGFQQVLAEPLCSNRDGSRRWALTSVWAQHCTLAMAVEMQLGPQADGSQHPICSTSRTTIEQSHAGCIAAHSPYIFACCRLWRVGGAGGDAGSRRRQPVAAPAGRHAGLRCGGTHAPRVHPAAGQLQGRPGAQNVLTQAAFCRPSVKLQACRESLLRRSCDPKGKRRHVKLLMLRVPNLLSCTHGP